MCARTWFEISSRTVVPKKVHASSPLCTFDCCGSFHVGTKSWCKGCLKALQTHQHTGPHKREVSKPRTASSNSQGERASWSQNLFRIQSQKGLITKLERSNAERLYLNLKNVDRHEKNSITVSRKRRWQLMRRWPTTK